MQITDSHEAKTQQNDDEQLKSALESLLFVAGRPLEQAELRRLLAINDGQLDAALTALAAECKKRGVRVQRLGEQVQLVSAPENARYIAALFGLPTQAKLTTAALETLAVIAYRQPITRSQIETIRSVNSDRALASLIAHSLVSEVGRAATIGRPALFATTPEFLQQFGLTSLDELPRLNIPSEALQEAETSTTNGAVHSASEANGRSGPSKAPAEVARVEVQLTLPDPSQGNEEGSA
jgi:segregation and condensation protein B